MYKSLTYIVPVYKTPLELLERCLDSIEVSMNNNNSDSSECIIAFDGKNMNINHKERDSRFKFIEFSHMGTFECRKNAIGCSTGDLIINVDSDDTVAYNTESVIINEMNKHGYDMSFNPTIEIPSGIIRNIPKTKEEYIKTFIEGRMTWKNSICNLSIVSKELGKLLVEITPNIMEYIMFEDQYMSQFYLHNCSNFGLIESPNPLYMHYYGVGISTQYTKPRSFIQSQLEVTYKCLRGFYTEEELEKYWENERLVTLKFKED